MQDKTFIKVTNKDIYDLIKTNHDKQEEINKQIISRLDITNGKVKLNRWIATTGLTIALLAIGLILK